MMETFRIGTQRRKQSTYMPQFVRNALPHAHGRGSDRDEPRRSTGARASAEKSSWPWAACSGRMHPCPSIYLRPSAKAKLAQWAVGDLPFGQTFVGVFDGRTLRVSAGLRGRGRVHVHCPFSSSARVRSERGRSCSLLSIRHASPLAWAGSGSYLHDHDDVNVTVLYHSNPSRVAPERIARTEAVAHYTRSSRQLANRPEEMRARQSRRRQTRIILLLGRPRPMIMMVVSDVARCGVHTRPHSDRVPLALVDRNTGWGCQVSD